jgi:RNA polymerase sigma factor (TIGR02999 family)
MSTVPQGDVTRLLEEIDSGDEAAKRALFDRLYEELRNIARSLMAHQDPGRTLQATALVHECYLKLRPGDLKGRNRSYLFGAVARAMRQILVDHARTRNALKRGVNWGREPLDGVLDSLQKTQGLDILSLHQALEELESLAPRQHEVVTRRFFGGCTMEEIADQLGVTLGTVERDWRGARAWLHAQLKEE